MANEKRLIDVEQAKRATYEEIFWTESEQAVVRHFLAKLPKVDAEEVVHAEWRLDGFCTNCSNRAEVQSIGFNCTGGTRIEYKRTRFCSECGAKMDGERRKSN